MAYNMSVKSTPQRKGHKTEIEKRIESGEFQEAVKLLSVKNIEPVLASSGLKALMLYLFKVQTQECARPDYVRVTKLAVKCGQILGLYDNKNNPLENADLICVYYHHIIYALFTKKLFGDIFVLHTIVVNLSKHMQSSKDAKKKEAFLKSLIEVEKILWRTAMNLATTSPKDAFQLFCDVFVLISNIPCRNISLIYRHISEAWSAVIFKGNGSFKAEVLLDNIKFSNEFQNLTKEEEKSLDDLLAKVFMLILKRIKSNELAVAGKEIDALKNLASRGLFDKEKFTIASSTFYAISNLGKSTFTDCRLYLEDEKSGPFVAHVTRHLNEHLDIVVKNVPQKSISEYICFTLDSWKYLNTVEVLSSLEKFLVIMNPNTMTSVKEDDCWEDHGIKSVELLKNILKQSQKFFKKFDPSSCSTVLIIFQKILHYSYNLLSLQYYYESYNVYDIFFDTVFTSIQSLQCDQDHLHNLLISIGKAFKNARYLITSYNNADKSDKLHKLFNQSLLFLASVTHSQEVLSLDMYSELLKTSITLWCEFRATPGYDKTYKNIIETWYANKKVISHQISPNVEEPSWKEILALEIFCYAENIACRDSVNHVVQAAAALENLPSQSDDLNVWWYSNLAVAYAKNQDENVETGQSLAIATSVVSKLLDELSKCKSSDVLAGLINACYQQYMSDQRDGRKRTEKLADIPLLSRVAKEGPGGESTAVESWEVGEELSQLGQVLSCRNETRCIYPLSQIHIHAASLIKLGIKDADSKHIASVLFILECVGYIFSTLGNYWLAMKTWGLLFSLAELAKCSRSQLVAISNIVSQYKLIPDSEEDIWVQQSVLQLENSLTDIGNLEKFFVTNFLQLSMARCFMLSDKMTDAADVVLEMLPKLQDCTNHDTLELLIKCRLLASRLMVALPPNTQQRHMLFEMEKCPLEAAKWAADISLKIVNTSKLTGIERNINQLRRQELMIETNLWAATYATFTGCNSLANISLRSLLTKIQRLMLPTRVAQVLSCLGDIDLLTPDTTQLNQRLYWNQKILSLGSTIEGRGEPVRNIRQGEESDASPTRCYRKQYQLTAACSLQCSKSAKPCCLCKNPLYHLCKAHYAFLIEENENTFCKLYQNLQSWSKSQISRLWSLTWGKLLQKQTAAENSSVEAWIPLLTAGIDILECRQKLIHAARQAEMNNPSGALETVNNVIKKLKTLKHEAAPLLLNWGMGQLSACLCQMKGIGYYSPKLMAPCTVPAEPEVSYELDDDESANVVATPPTPPKSLQQSQKLVPKKPGRRILTANENGTPTAAKFLKPPKPLNLEDLTSKSKVMVTPKVKKGCKILKENVSPSSSGTPKNRVISNTKSSGGTPKVASPGIQNKAKAVKTKSMKPIEVKEVSPGPSKATVTKYAALNMDGETSEVQSKGGILRPSRIPTKKTTKTLQVKNPTVNDNSLELKGLQAQTETTYKSRASRKVAQPKQVSGKTASFKTEPKEVMLEASLTESFDQSIIESSLNESVLKKTVPRKTTRNTKK